MEPRFSLPESTPRSSKSEIVIGGVKIYIYGLDELERKSGVEIGVLYLAHMRTRTYLVTEAIAHEVLHQYRTDVRKKKYELIAVTMDMRNHGERVVSPRANLTWRDGNENHAQVYYPSVSKCCQLECLTETGCSMDLLSTISGSAQDFKLILDYLPSYFPQFTRFHNIMTGISLGGHTAYRIASLASGKFEGFAIVVGCPTLAPLLLNRLGIDPKVFGSTASELGGVSYDELKKVMNTQQRRRWPRALAELIREGDKKAYEEFPTDVPLLLCNGKEDPLVPAFYTASWLERRREVVSSPCGGETVQFFVQENTGHSCTKEMVVMIAAWVGDLFEARTVQSTFVPTESRL